MFWLHMPTNLSEGIRFVIPAVLTLIIAGNHVQLNALQKRAEALVQKLTDKGTQI